VGILEGDALQAPVLGRQNRVNDEVCKACRVGVGNRLRIAGRWRRFWREWAPLADLRDNMLPALRHRHPLGFQHHAMVLAIPAAAGWNISACRSRQDKQRRDRRHGDDQQDRDGEKASQNAIIRQIWKDSRAMLGDEGHRSP